ncbi:hypothetical protein QBC46DRAFT_405609 [Diplogelasinospora grovesii]|uniref:CCHC-type domain-containing protein n=1 Tax=Diplogelasinospora grovesii TaxID=303347 RepID=A0AAN6ND96_9PEZI|nr:hypothetical protein QBC46DRAFT_405609 [Diplogelasinospora grovesii]
MVEAMVITVQREKRALTKWFLNLFPIPKLHSLVPTDSKVTLIHLSSPLLSPLRPQRRLTTTLQVALISKYLDSTVDFNKYARYGSEIALSFKQSYQKRDKEKKKFNARARTPTSNHKGGGGNKGGKSTPSSSSNSGTRPGKPSAAEIKKLLKEGRCFICREVGHQNRNCPNKDKVNKDRDARIQEIAERYIASLPNDRVEDMTNKNGESTN